MKAKTYLEVDLTVHVDSQEFIYRLYQLLRNNSLLKFDDPHDDHPNFIMTSTSFRNRFESVVKELAEKLPIMVEADT